MRRAARAISPQVPPLIGCAGPGPANAEAEARRLAAAGAAGLLSFGLAGGLDPKCAPGDIILAERVISSPAEAVATNPSWRDRIANEAHGMGCDVIIAPMAASDQPVVAVAAKQQLHARTGAVAVDLESHAVGMVAEAAGLPFVALRAIADPARRRIPSAALAGLAPSGGRRPLAVAAALSRRPWELPDVLRLALDSAAALAVLRRVAGAVPALFTLG